MIFEISFMLVFGFVELLNFCFWLDIFIIILVLNGLMVMMMVL